MNDIHYMHFVLTLNNPKLPHKVYRYFFFLTVGLIRVRPSQLCYVYVVAARFDMRVLGVGVGVAVLVVIWVAATVAVLACARSKVVVAVGITLVAAVFSLILLVLPQHSAPHVPEPQDSVTDYLFIFRVVIVVISGLSALVGFGAVVGHWTEPILGKPLKKVRL